MVTFALELPLLMGSQWVGYGLVIGINYVDVVGVGWGRSWLVRTPGHSEPTVTGVAQCATER